MRDLFFKDWAWKLFSLLLAVVIWFTVHRILVESASPKQAGDASTLTYGNLPVTLVTSVTSVADMRGYRPLQPTVSVTVSGPPAVIATLQANQLHATINLTDATMINSGKQHVEVSVPPGVTLVSIKPESIGILSPP